MMITDRQWTAISYFSTQCISFITYPVGNTRNIILPISALTTVYCWLQGMLSEVWLRVCKTMSHSVGAYSQSVMSKSWGKSRLLIVWLFLAQLAEGRIITHEKMSVCLSVSVSLSQWPKSYPLHIILNGNLCMWRCALTTPRHTISDFPCEKLTSVKN